MERDGRFVSLRTTNDPVAHRAFAEAWLARIPEIEARRDELLDRLDAVLKEAGPAACVATASLTYLHKNPDTYRESEDDRSPAHVEFLALCALPILLIEGDPEASVPVLTSEALHLVREAFRDTSELLALRGVQARLADDANSAALEYRYDAQAEALLVRGTAYPEHTKLILDGCFAPFDDECRRVLGFTREDAWRLIQALPDVIGARVVPRLQDARAEARVAAKHLKRMRRRGQLPPEIAQMRPSLQTSWIRLRTVQDAYADPVGLALLTPDALANASNVEPAAAAAWLELLHCPPSEYVEAYHRAPVGGHPLTRRPLLKLAEGYLAPAANALVEALRPAMEDAIRLADQDLWDRYERHRASWVEQTAAERLGAVLPGSEVWTAVPWADDDDDSDLDGLVTCDDLTLRVQAKAGRISAPARRGAPSMTEDVTAVVADAMHQHARLAVALSRRSADELGFSAKQVAALARRFQIEVVVCLDDITVWGTETHRLRQLVDVPESPQLPWVLSLADLLATTDLLGGAQLAHFLTRRLRLEHEGRVEAHDELDWVGHYLSDGLFFDDWFQSEDALDVFSLMSYTEPIDSWYFSRAGLTSRVIPKPVQPMPVGLAGLLRRLEKDKPNNWITAGMFLLNGNDESRELVAQCLDHTIDRAAEVGWSNASQRFDGYGLTLWADRRYAGAEFVRLLEGYADQKIAELERTNWVVIGLGADGHLHVLVRETDPGTTLGHVLTQRQRSDS